MLHVAPLFSSNTIPGMARIGFAFFIASLLLPFVVEQGYPLPNDYLHFFLLAAGEALIGILIGFFLDIIFNGFLITGQLFSLHMGFSASEVFDPLAQTEVPLMGQFLNVIAMFVFVFLGGFNKFIIVGILKSFQSIKAVDLIMGREVIFSVMLKSMGKLFENALIMSFPILGTLLLISLTMGLLAKAAPQMNLLMLGFPISIGFAFILLFLLMPMMMQSMGRLIDASFESLTQFLMSIKGVKT
jgi:flagellar biosynthetic protein FliR